jgi:hypothetical protein
MNGDPLREIAGIELATLIVISLGQRRRTRRRISRPRARTPVRRSGAGGDDDDDDDDENADTDDEDEFSMTLDTVKTMSRTMIMRMLRDGPILRMFRKSKEDNVLEVFHTLDHRFCQLLPTINRL